jgi:hypothetical protein
MGMRMVLVLGADGDAIRRQLLTRIDRIASDGGTAANRTPSLPWRMA